MLYVYKIIFIFIFFVVDNKVGEDEIRLGYWGLPCFTDAPELYNWFDWQSCQDVKYNVVVDIILPLHGWYDYLNL